ncbi:hypothetical protein Mmc1_1717 [Magnetococcus marinus MC-1]|uniref:Uncharacterized protein n=1 Tax=Magnetococcus marinus (strain ATCC BAA-1437 / JCM 17883 / MC-1) TaxID=156889 RepID=A0L8D2_MAGMM|nr:hypothetical protein [Magnetococcus marinus]ABK44225.1 hypothetical protein Mmc1_1717 [Magnetococcus marinus MC-1]
MSNCIDGTLGVNFTKRASRPDFQLGHTVRGNENTLWIYVLAAEAVATGSCTVNTTTYALTDAAGNHTAEAAFAAGEYGWVKQSAGLTV